MKIRTLLCLLLLLASTSCMAFTSDPISDSLRTALIKAINKKATNDTAVINSINKLANEYLSNYPDSSLYYGQIAIKSSRQINYSKGIADGLLSSASTYVNQGKYELAVKELTEAILIYNNTKDLLGVSNCYKIYGYLYNQTADYQKAIFYLTKSLTIKQKIKDLPGTARIYIGFGNVYDNLGRSSNALDCYFKSLNISAKLHNEKAMSANYNNIGVILQNMEIYPEALLYFNRALKLWTKMQLYGGIATTTQNIGEVLLAQGRYDEAIVYINKALAITIKQDDKDGISSGYNDLGLCYLNKKQNDKAKAYLEKSLKAAIENNIDYNQANTLISFALFYNTNNDYKKANDYALKAKTLADRLGSTLLRTNSSVQLIKALGGLGKYKEAFFAQKEFDRMKSGFKKDESVQRFSTYNSAYNYASKQQQQLLQQKARALLYQQKIHDQRLLNVIFFIIISAMLMIAIVYYRQKRKQIRINKLLLQKNMQVVEQKLNLDDQAEKLNDLNKLKDRLIAILAHDLRSPLSTLRGLFSLLEDETITHQELLAMIPEVLKKLEYTSDFLDTLLFWINSQMDNFDCNGKEFSVKELVTMETVNYQEQAASKGISLSGSVSEDLIAIADPNSVRIVIRNLVTNAIKFSRHNDTIEVSATVQDRDILVSIKDTGMGMNADQRDKLFKSKVESKSGTHNESGTGMGLLFCKDLVEKCNGTIWVNSEPGKGTTFCFTVPLHHVNAQVLQAESVVG